MRLTATMLGTAVFAALALAGCSSGPATDAYPGGPQSRKGDSADFVAPEPEQVYEPQDGPIVEWVESGRSFAVTLWGSGSCPDRPESIETTSDRDIVVTFTEDGDEICTADLGPYTHELDLPAEITERPVTVTVREPEYGDDYEVSTRMLE